MSILSKETQIAMLQYRINLLMREETMNTNLLRKARRQLRKLQAE